MDKQKKAVNGLAARTKEGRRPRVFYQALLGGTAFGMVAVLASRPANAYSLYTGTFNDQTLTINLETEIE
jgi:hypothetical protein